MVDHQTNGNNKKDLSPDEEQRIRQAFKEKDWNEIKSNDSWALFKNHG
jgi:hypothetical protein